MTYRVCHEMLCLFLSTIVLNFYSLSCLSGLASSLAECKSQHNSYLLGDVNLTDPRQACNLIQGQPLGPSWIGIAKEIYISIDGGKFQYNKRFLCITFFILDNGTIHNSINTRKILFFKANI